jgi:hypothetical protein
MISHDYAEGITQGFAQGAASTAERIRNALAAALAGPDHALRTRIVTLADEITRDYGLE